jgi:hypothetical protein
VLTTISLAAALLLAGLPAQGPAQPPAPPDPKAQLAKVKECIRKASAEVAKVTYARKDVEKFLAEWQSFEALDEKGDDAKEQDGPDCQDFSKVIGDPKYVAWARARGLEPRTWMQKSLRISLTFAKRRAPAQAEEGRRQIAKLQEGFEGACKRGQGDACAQLKQMTAAGEAMIQESLSFMALFPEPTKAEGLLLEEFGSRLAVAMEGRNHRDRGSPYRDDAEAAADDEGPSDDAPSGPPARRGN